jgi:hypothetical protein
MLRGKEIPYKDEGRDVMQDVLEFGPHGDIAVNGRQAEYHQTKPSPEPIRYYDYSEFPAFHWK